MPLHGRGGGAARLRDPRLRDDLLGLGRGDDLRLRARRRRRVGRRARGGGDRAPPRRCDEGFAGYDCSERECPRGDDPLTAGVDEVQLLTCDCGEPGGCGNGTIALAFRGQRTAPIPADATAELLEFHLERLSTLGDVDVAYYGGGLDGSLCSDAGTTAAITFLATRGDPPALNATWAIEGTTYGPGRRADVRLAVDGAC